MIARSSARDESGVHRQQGAHAREQQTGAGKQHHRQRHLRHDQGATERACGAAAAGAAASLRDA